MRLRFAAARTAHQPHVGASPRGVTRRRLLATGGAAGAAAMLGAGPWSVEAATAAPDTPAYLLRSSYLDLSTPRFTAGAATLKLEAVNDLQVAATDRSFVNSEDAFALEFSSSSPLAAGIYGFSHPDLGSFSFFVAQAGGKGGYEVIVNRSVNAPKHYPKPPRQPATDSTPAADDTTVAFDHLPPQQPGKKQHKPKVHVRRATARRVGRELLAHVSVTAGVHVKSASVWILHGSRVVAAGTVRHPHGQRFAVRLPLGHRARGGHYVLLIATVDRNGREQTRRSKITVQ